MSACKLGRLYALFLVEVGYAVVVFVLGYLSGRYL